MSLANPIALLLFILLLLIVFIDYKNKKRSSVTCSNISDLIPFTDRKTFVKIQFLKWLKYGVIALLIIALSQPQSVKNTREIISDGIDIMLVVDASGSMNSEDFQPTNRLTVSKQVIKNFIQKRTTDRIGLVVFGSDAYTQCPLTLDTNILLNFVDLIQVGIAGDATAMGMGISTALNRLKNSKAKSKIMILLTDGVSNTGEIAPIQAAELAKTMGVRIYTIGIGTKEGALLPIQDPVYGKVYARNPDGSLMRTEIDEEMLKTISAKTKGQFFRAYNVNELKTIYSKIDQLEKSKIQTKTYHHYTDYFMYFIAAALCLLIVWIILKSIFWVIVP